MRAPCSYNNRPVNFIALACCQLLPSSERDYNLLVPSPASFSASQASQQLLRLPRDQKFAVQRQNLERQLQEDALFQRHMGEIKQSILPRLREILRQLLIMKGSRRILLENPHAQLACNILCASLLSEGLSGAQHFLQYTGCTPGTSGFGQKTSNIEEFRKWESETWELQRMSQDYGTLKTRKEHLEDLLAKSSKEVVKLQHLLKVMSAPGPRTTALERDLRAAEAERDRSNDAACTADAARRCLEEERDALLQDIMEMKSALSRSAEVTRANTGELRAINERVDVMLADNLELQQKLNHTSEELERVRGEHKENTGRRADLENVSTFVDFRGMVL
jgi:hypothetical protein